MRLKCRDFSPFYLSLAASVGLTAVSGPANAMIVTPLVAEMQSSGGKSKTIVRVTNDGAQPLPIEFKFNRIEVDENGASTSTPSEGEFKIFPQRSSIDPGKSQIFQVQWINSSPIEKSRSYTLSVNQLPVKFPSAKTGVQVVYNMSLVLNVSPPDAKTSIGVVASAVSKDSAGRNRPTVVFQNSGNRHVNLSDTTLTVSGGKWSKTLSNFELKQLIGVGLVQPGKRRKFVLPLDVPTGVTSISATIDASGLTTSALAK